MAKEQTLPFNIGIKEKDRQEITDGLFQTIGGHLHFIFSSLKIVKKFALKIHDPEFTNMNAELVGIDLGEGDYGKPALIHTDIFKISLLYSTFNLEQGKNSMETQQGQRLKPDDQRDTIFFDALANLGMFEVRWGKLLRAICLPSFLLLQY